MKTSEQRSFSEKIRRRNRLLWGVFALMLCYMVVISELGGGDSRKMTDLADSLSRIIFFGGMLWVLVRIAKNKNLLKKENYEKLQQKFLEEQDERNRLIYEKSGGLVWDVIFIAELCVTLTASLFDMSAFYTALSVLLVSLAAKVTAHIVYSRNL